MTKRKEGFERNSFTYAAGNQSVQWKIQKKPLNPEWIGSQRTSTNRLWLEIRTLGLVKCMLPVK